MNKMISMKSRFTTAINARISGLRRNMSALANDTSGEGYLDMAMKILIVVVVGAAIMAIMNTALPGLFQSLIDKISSQIAGITILQSNRRSPGRSRRQQACSVIHSGAQRMPALLSIEEVVRDTQTVYP